MLFDLDGTLVDTSSGVWASVHHATELLALPRPTHAQLLAMIGPPLQEGCREVLGIPAEDVDEAVSAYRAHYAAGALLDVTVYAGVVELLAELRVGGATLAVATSKPEAYALRILEHIGLRTAFASVHGATLAGAVRHKQEVVGLALAAHPGGCRPVLIGDRAQDAHGAAAHGIPCIGAGWGPAADGELLAAGAAVVVPTPAGVPAALVDV